MALGAALFWLAGTPTAGICAAGDRSRTEADLKAISTQIEKIRAQAARDAVERDKASQTLRSAEVSAAQARAELEELRRQRATHAANRADLARRRAESESTLKDTREALASQLRAAYVIGRDEPLKLLLNQKDPARAGRMFAYYGYFGRMRADQISRVNAAIGEIAELDNALAAEDERLAALEKEQKSQVADLDRARKERRQVLASLDSESKSRERSLQRLQRQQASLEKLMKDLGTALKSYPPDNSTAFGRLRGKLDWPVGGKLVAGFGQTRAGGVKWSGMLVSTERGSPVRAIAGGRVAYADWLPGLGLLVIVDHGEGYMSLYAHNDRLAKQAGAQISAGDVVANAGDSGGRSQPELYFEIRKGGKPVDPRPWMASASPR
jgi:septal ring factor EnvC (AmiA/AmiB activator)